MHSVDILHCIENHGASMLGKLKVYKNSAQTMKKKVIKEHQVYSIQIHAILSIINRCPF